MKQARRSQAELIQEIWKYLVRHEEASVNEISDNIGSNWDTVEALLETLAEMGIVSENVQGKARVFRLKSVQKSTPRRNDTLFGLPLSEREELYSKYVFHTVIEEWKNRRGHPPSKTHLQKASVEIANKLNLPIPRGWYLYGQLCVLQQQNTEIPPEITEVPPESSQIQEVAKQVVGKLSALPTTEILLAHVYQRSGFELYETKHELQQLPRLNLENEGVRRSVANRLYRFLMYIPKSVNDETNELVKAFVAMVVRILSQAQKPNIYRDAIFDANCKIWQIVANVVLVESLSTGGYYSREMLQEYLDQELMANMQSAHYALSNLVSICDDFDKEQETHPPIAERGKRIEGDRNLSAEETEEVFHSFLMTEFPEDYSDIVREPDSD